MVVAALLVLLTAGLATAIRPGIVLVKELGTGSNSTTTTTIATTTSTIPSQPQLIGGQTDIHGCLTAAGFAWNATTQNCVRPWNGDVQLSTGTVLVNISDPNWREKLTITAPVPTSVKCADTDEGKDYFTAGTVYAVGKTPRKDGCMRLRLLTEWYCSNDKPMSTLVICKEGCKNGACVPEVTTTTTSTSTTISTTTTTLIRVRTTLPVVTTTTIPSLVKTVN